MTSSLGPVTGQPAKQPAAHRWPDRLWATGTGRLSTQVLSEYDVTVARTLVPGMGASAARADLSDLKAWSPLCVTPELVADAWKVEDLFGLSFWDSPVVAAAQAGRGDRLLTEDLQDGQDLDGLTIVGRASTSGVEISLDRCGVVRVWRVARRRAGCRVR